MGNEQSSKRSDYGHHGPAPARNAESAAQAQARLARAERFEGKVKKFVPKDAETIKQEHWKRYASLGKDDPANQSTQPSQSSQLAFNKSSGNVLGTANNQLNQSTMHPPTQSSSQTVNKSPPQSTNQLIKQSMQSNPDPDRARAARAAAMEAKTAKIKVYKKVGSNSQWDAYKELEAAEQKKMSQPNRSISQSSPSPTTEPDFLSQDNQSPESNNQTAHQQPSQANDQSISQSANQSVNQSAPSSASPFAASFYQSADPKLQLPEDADDFQSQLVMLVGIAQSMPLSSKQLMHRILGNLLKLKDTPTNQSIDQSINNQDKYRKLNLNSAKIQSEIVQVPGAIEILYAVGFEESENGESLFFSPSSSLSMAEIAHDKLDTMLTYGM